MQFYVKYRASTSHSSEAYACTNNQHLSYSASSSHLTQTILEHDFRTLLSSLANCRQCVFSLSNFESTH